ncbi:MAG: N-formylglutamate amidohydrolase [Cyclobacteriaceae bacterium]
MAETGLLISCEHGGYEVPPAYAALFVGQEKILKSHRGWDPGALDMARQIASQLQAPLEYATVTRLLVELNRSPHHPQLFSALCEKLNDYDRRQLLHNYYLPYRQKVEQNLGRLIGQHQKALHISIHSFTPILNGEVREVDIGLLFDPARKWESLLCEVMKKTLEELLPAMRIRFNEPYLGIDDGLTSYLRTRFEDLAYAGIEIEVNQKWVDSPELEQITAALYQALGRLVKES